MTDFFWPTSLTPNSSEWRLIANTAAFSSPLTGTTRTIGRGGDRWACTLTFNNLTGDNRAILQAFLAQLRGQANRVYVRDHSYRKRGAFPTSNLVPAIDSTTAWTQNYLTLAAADGIGRLTAISHTGVQIPAIVKSSITVTNAAAYAIRGFFVRSSTGTASLGVAVTDGTNTASSGVSTDAGMKTALLVVTGTSATAAYYLDATGSSAATGDFADMAYVSLARCMRVNGASQTGSLLYVDGLNSAGDLLAGDLIEVNGEFNMVADTFNGPTASKIRLVRPLRSSPATLAPVIIHDPMCKMMLTDQTVGWSNVPGRFSSMTVELVEDIL